MVEEKVEVPERIWIDDLMVKSSRARGHGRYYFDNDGLSNNIGEYVRVKLNVDAPNTRQRAERAAQRIHEHLAGSNPHQVYERAIADIIAAELEK